MLRIYILLPLIFLYQLSVGQEFYDKENCKERSGFEYGGIAGIYIPNNSNASFYSGKPDNENNVNYIFSNSYWYEEMRHLLDFHDTAFVLEYPEKMGYSPAFSFGLFAKYDFNCHRGIYIQFYYAKLRANDIVTIEVDPPQDYLAEPDIRLCPIKGVEERNIVDLGYTNSLGLNKTIRLTLGGGISMNNTMVKENVIYIAEKKYNLVHVYGNRPYVPNTNQQTYEIRQRGIGFGVYGTLGLRMEFAPTVAIEPGCSLHYMKINLKENSNYTPEINLYVKMIFRDLLNFSN
ncbi:MAG TPA: hypothetical protein VK212_10440 [Lentimicrobium sp.]|nr:hypothetical protein [Lentimicrobium sp.]